jgi:hypothetical protein
MAKTHFGICTDTLETVGVDSASKVAPERVLDHPRQARDGILAQTCFVQDDGFLAVVSCECELLKKVGEHVGPSDL